LGEPVVLGHGGDDDFLGFGGWGEFEVEVEEKIVVGGVVFRREDDEGAGEAVMEIVVDDGGEAGPGLRAGGELRVGAIGGNLCGGGHRGEDSFRFVRFKLTNPFSGGRGERTQLCTPGLVDFHGESGARGGG
jgi:hypothetical protein